MKRIFISAAIVAATLCACEGLPENSAHRRGSGSDGWTYRNENGATLPPTKDTTIYTVGIEYPSSYDWRRDTAYGNINCRIVVFAGQKRILEADAGPGTFLSADPDMHRIWDGHLWSDFSDGTHTVISKDGKEVFRYEGNEMICGFMVHEGSVHTLGRSRSGKGFSYRKDGNVVLADDSGTPVGDPYSSPSETGSIYLDQGKVCFGFKRTENGTDRWFAVRDGDVEPIDCGVKMTGVTDIRYVEGRMHITGTSATYGRRAIHVCGSTVELLWKDDVLATSYCHIIPSGGNLFFLEGHVRKDGKAELSLLKEGPQVLTYGTGYAGFWLDNGIYAYLSGSSDGTVSMVRAGDRYWWFNDKVLLMSHQCVRYGDGRLLIAVTPVRKELSPILWKDGKNLALPLHGFLAGVFVSHGSSQH